MLPPVLISSDSHVIEPADLWTTRGAKPWRDRAPRIVSETNGDWWYVDGQRLFSVTGGTETGKRFQGNEKLRVQSRMAEVIAGAWDPAAKLKDMDADGVWGELVYPTTATTFWWLPDTDYAYAMMRCYNDWVAEFAAAQPKRIKALGLVTLDDIPRGIKELEHCAAIGLAGAMISVYPGAARHYALPLYEPFWAAAQDLGMTLNLHTGSQRLPRAERKSSDPGNAALSPFQLPSSYCTTNYWVQLSLADIIFSGVFERYPKLKVVSVEFEAAWAAHFIHTMDYTYTQRIRRADWPRFQSSALPSDFFRRNVSVSFQEDALAVRMRRDIGVDTLTWGTDYPHAESTFPHSRKIVARLFKDVPDAEQQKMLCTNAARLYGFRLPKPGRGSDALRSP